MTSESHLAWFLVRKLECYKFRGMPVRTHLKMVHEDKKNYVFVLSFEIKYRKYTYHSKIVSLVHFYFLLGLLIVRIPFSRAVISVFCKQIL
jgi:hypothetical protein